MTITIASRPSAPSSLSTPWGLSIPSRLSDAELVAEVSRCARDEHGATAQLVAHLAEFDTRRLHLAAGYSSLFSYCREVLGLSEGGSYNRIEAARAARRFPVILERLASGTLNLTTVRMVAKRLTAENHLELLAAVSRRSKSEVEEVLARRFPEPDTPSSVRKVPERSVPPPMAQAVPDLAPALSSEPPAVMLRVTPPRPLVKPLAPGRYEIRFTAGASTRDKLRVAQDLLRHAVPSGDPAEIFDRALSALIQDLSRGKLAVVRKPKLKPRPTAAGSRHVPSDVKRAVWRRDGGHCAFVGAAGHRCQERAFLEYHHVLPYAVGGAATIANIQLRCRSHNAYEAEVFYDPRRERGPAVVSEAGQESAVSWGLGLVPERVGRPNARDSVT